MSSRDPNLCVRVTNLSKLLKESHLRELFECCGRIASCMLTTENGSRVCLVEYDDASHAKAASFLNGTPLGDLNLNVVLMSDYLSAKAPPLPAAVLPPPLPPAQVAPAVQPPPPPPPVPMMGLLPGLLAGLVPPAVPQVPAAVALAAAIPPLNPVLNAMIANGTAPPVPPVLAVAGLTPIQAAANAALLERASQPPPPPPAPVPVVPLSGASAALAMAASDPNNQVSAAAKARIDEVARTVYVGNISHALTEDHLRTFFSPIGPIAYVKLAGEMNGVRYGFVEYEKLEHANLALGLSGRVLGDRALKVGKAHNPIIKNDKGHADNAAFVAANKPGPTVDKAEAARRAMEALKKLTNKVTGVADPSDDKKRKSSRSRSPVKSNGHTSSSSSRRKSSRSRSPHSRRSPSPRGGGSSGMYSSRYGGSSSISRDVREFVGHDYQTSTGAFAHRSGWRDYRAGAGEADRERERADRDRYYADRDRERADRDRSDRERGAAGAKSSSSSSSSTSSASSSSSSSSSSSRSRKDEDRSGMFWDGFAWNPLPGTNGAAVAGPLSAAKHEKYQKSAQYDAERGRTLHSHDKPATHSH